jgi:hypothetical protein
MRLIIYIEPSLLSSIPLSSRKRKMLAVKERRKEK